MSKWQAVKLVLKDWKILLLIFQQVRRLQHRFQPPFIALT